ncbi:hypothetical protein VDGL01_08985 [Verticillium dahliae]
MRHMERNDSRNPPDPACSLGGKPPGRMREPSGLLRQTPPSEPCSRPADIELAARETGHDRILPFCLVAPPSETYLPCARRPPPTLLGTEWAECIATRKTPSLSGDRAVQRHVRSSNSPVPRSRAPHQCATPVCAFCLPVCL